MKSKDDNPWRCAKTDPPGSSRDVVLVVWEKAWSLTSSAAEMGRVQYAFHMSDGRWKSCHDARTIKEVFAWRELDLGEKPVFESEVEPSLTLADATPQQLVDELMRRVDL